MCLPSCTRRYNTRWLGYYTRWLGWTRGRRAVNNLCFLFRHYRVNKRCQLDIAIRQPAAVVCAQRNLNLFGKKAERAFAAHTTPGQHHTS